MNTFNNIIRGAGLTACVLLLAVQMGGCSSKCPCSNKGIHRPKPVVKIDNPVAEPQQKNEQKTNLSVTEK
ncbi:hypothetical protein CPBP_00245 [Candidatus Bodocaedibacter vickermanii]|uniref:Uncharacterized protein n=1 Tax=Candidatus Bodocaedibacter vickermanii TaxID=2741701 RepID=A0A7L9RSG6_9PROT|nr:hypothetical protein CPBP_00245 [Candidatus Paracaedibacteraceae bacterium 'Lake Konstanz']